MNVKSHPHRSPSLCVCVSVCVMELQLHSGYYVLGTFLVAEKTAGDKNEVILLV